MDLQGLPFARIFDLHEDRFEVMIDDGVRMNPAMVGRYHDFLRSNLHPPFSLLRNRINACSYDFDVREKLATIDEINAMAVVACDRVSAVATGTLASFPRTVEWNLAFFSNREDALAWRHTRQDAVRARSSSKDHTDVPG